jgi:hypothetical protein
MIDVDATRLVLKLCALAAKFNHARVELAALGVRVDFIVHPETGNIGMRLPSEALALAQGWAANNPLFEVEILTIN